jgi:hypothetical protein
MIGNHYNIKTATSGQIINIATRVLTEEAKNKLIEIGFIRCIQPNPILQSSEYEAWKKL